MKLLYIGLQRVWKHTCALLPHIDLSAVHGEAQRARNAVLRHIHREIHAVVPLETRRNHGQHISGEIRERLCIRVLRLLHTELNNLPLSLRSRVVIVHVAQARVRDSLNSIQMVHARALQLHGADACALDRLRDVGIDILELRVADVHIHPAENIDARRDGLPVEGDVVRDIQIQILVQRLDRELRSSDRVGGIDLAVGAVCE